MKFLHEKNEQFQEPSWRILDVFPNPGVDSVTLEQKEFTSVCPLTKQPDYCTVTIQYVPKEFCVESKSLKLYLSAYRNIGAFAETLSVMIADDLQEVLKAKYLNVTVQAASRGGISIKAATEREA